MVSTKIQDEVKVRILLMERFFLYLPLFIAKSDLEKPFRKRPFFGMVPEKYDSKVALPERDAVGSTGPEVRSAAVLRADVVGAELG